MLAALSPSFPVLDEKKLPFSPRRTSGSSRNLEKFRQAIRALLGWKTLTRDQFLVFDVLVGHADYTTGYCFPRRESIATELGIDVATVSRATARLQELGIIAKFGRGGFSSSCDVVILFSMESFALAGMLHRGELDRFRLRNRDCPVPINLEEAIAYGLATSCDTEITGLNDVGVIRNEQAQIKGFILTGVNTQPEETTDSKPRKNPRRPSTPILKVLPEHWLEDGKQKRPDLDIRHVAGKFLAYHNRKGVRATPRWYSAWIRWVERENPALDRRAPSTQESATAPARPATANTAQVTDTPEKTSTTVPQTGTSESVAASETPAPAVQETPANTDETSDTVTATSPDTTTTDSTSTVTEAPSPTETTTSAPTDNTATPPPSVEATSQAPTPSPAAGFPDFGNDEQARRRHIEEMMTALRTGRTGAQRPGNQANNSSQGASMPATPSQTPQEPPKRFVPPHPLMDLLRPGKAPSASPQDQQGETTQNGRKTPTAGADAPEPPIPVISDEERKRRLEELLAQAKGKTLRDFGPG